MYGCLCWQDKDEIVGIIIEDDYKPTKIGKKILEEINFIGYENLIKELQRYSHWEQYLNGGVCRFCGKITGHGVSNNVKLLMESEFGEVDYPDPLEQFHRHLGPIKINPFVDPLTYEYVYFMNAPGKLTVWTTSPVAENIYSDKIIYSLKEYYEVIIAVVNTDNQPDWKEIEKASDLLWSDKSEFFYSPKVMAEMKGGHLLLVAAPEET